MSEIVAAYLPEFIIILFIIFNLTASLFFSTYLYKLSKWVTLLGIVLAMASTLYLQPETYAFNNTFLSNFYTLFFKILILMGGFFLTLLSRNMIREKRDRAFEYFSVFLSGILFAMCALSAVDFVGLFVSLEALGLSCYLLLSLNKNPNAKQLTFGYLVQGAVVSALFLTGLSLIYGMCAQFDFEQIGLFLVNSMHSGSQPQVLLTFSLILIISISTFAEYYFGMTYRLLLQASQKTYVISYIRVITLILNTLITVVLIKLKFSIHLVKLVSAIIYVFRPILQNIYVKKKFLEDI